MALIRATLYFEQEGYGWTESYWREGPPIETGNYITVTDRLAQKRIKLSGNNTFLKYLRFSEENVYRDSFGYSYTGGGLTGPAATPSAAPQLALLTRMRNLSGTKLKLTYLRGFWDSVSTNGGQYTPTTAFVAYFDDWRSALINDSWGWYGGLSRVQGNLTSITENINGTFGGILEANLFTGPFPKDLGVTISGVQGATQANGPVRIKALSETGFNSLNRVAIFPYTVGGRVTLPTKGFIPIGSVAINRVVERRPGRPSYLSAGRRTA